jgi:hypothetical protein
VKHYIDLCNSLEGNTGETSQPSPAVEAKDTDVEMAALAFKSRTLPGCTSGIQQVCTSPESLASILIIFHQQSIKPLPD